MESPSLTTELPSPSTIGRLITSYVQQSAERHEERAHKALNILHQKDVQLARLQERLLELEALKLTMSQNPPASQDQPEEAPGLVSTGRRPRRRDQLPHTKYVPVPCAAGKVSEKIQYYERPGCVEESSQRRTVPQNVEWRLPEANVIDIPGGNADRRGQNDAGIPRLNLPTSPGRARGGCANYRPGDATQGGNADFVKRFLDVKLMEASIICQEMKRDAPRPGGENGKLRQEPETSVLFAKQQSRKSAAKSCSSESMDSLRSSRSRSRESLKDACGGAPAGGAPAAKETPEPPEPPEPPEHQYRRLIDHLTLCNRELKAELTNVHTRAAEDRKMHLAEVTKLQQCVLEMKETISAELSTPSASVLGLKNTTALFSRNVSSQTEDGMFDLKPEEGGCSNEDSVEDEEPKGTSRTTQTDKRVGRGCVCCSLGDSELPPQWLLAEALAHTSKAEAAMGVAHRPSGEIKILEIEAVVEVKDAFSSTEEICTKVASTQVDLSDTKAKDITIEAQELDIAALKKKVDELSQEIVNLGEASRKKLDKERKAHQRVQIETEKKMINFCNIVAGDVEIPYELFPNMGDEKSGESSSGNSSRESRKVPGRKMSARLATVSRWDVQATRRYVKTLKAKLRVLKSKGDRATERIADLEQSLAQKEKGLTATERCMEELLAEVTQLRAACSAPKVFAVGLEDGTGDGVFAGDKIDKQADNSKAQNVHTRLRNVNQQLIARSRALQNIQQEMKEMQNSMQNARNRLSRSETLNQNKQLIIENYKRRLDEIVTKEVATANRNSSLTTENHHLKDVINNLKKQISQIQSGKSHCWDAENKEASRKIGEKPSSEKLIPSQSEDDLKTLVDIDRMKCNFESKIEEASSKLAKSEHRVAELQDTLERFLRLAQAHFASQTRDDADADADGDASTAASRFEARALACSILNLTHGQLDSMLGSGGVAADSQLMEWLDECERLYLSETFAEKLATHLLEILKNLLSKSRGRAREVGKNRC